MAAPAVGLAAAWASFAPIFEGTGAASPQLCRQHSSVKIEECEPLSIHKTIFEMGVIACSDRLCTTFICMMQVVLL